MSSPLIGVTACMRAIERHEFHAVARQYVHAVADGAGGLPLIIPALGETLERSDRIQVPVGPWPVRSAQNGEAAARMTIRLSAQGYNEPEDYDRLADALRRHLGDPRRAEP